MYSKNTQIKKEAYCRRFSEGLLQRASEYGFSENAVMDIVKTATYIGGLPIVPPLNTHIPDVTDEVRHRINMFLPARATSGDFVDGPPLPPSILQKLESGVSGLGGTFSAGTDYIKEHLPYLGPSTLGAAALGSFALATYLSNKNKPKQK